MKETMEPWNFMTFHILGMSSSQLTMTFIFFRGVGIPTYTNHQPAMIVTHDIPSGKYTKNYGTSPFFMGKSTISMGHFQ
jgi:hypothetical protein